MKRSLLFLFIFVLSTLVIFSCATPGRLIAVNSKDAPKAIGPYSQAVRMGNMVFTSGQIGLSPTTNAMVGKDIVSQTHQALKNISAVLLASRSDMKHVIKVTIYLKDMDDYAKVNDIYKNYFPGITPARSVVQVARLPKDALIEIECVGMVK